MTLLRKSLELSFLWVAATSLNAQEQTMTEEPTEDVEVVEVYGQIPLGELENILQEAQMDFMKLFNEYNDNPLFEVTCQRIAQTGSNLKREYCEPNFVGKARNAEYQRLSYEYPRKIRIGNPTDAQVEKASAKDGDSAMDHMVKLLNENEELRNKYLEFVAAKKAYENRKGSQ